jgi:hypothetical protein
MEDGGWKMEMEGGGDGGLTTFRTFLNTIRGEFKETRYSALVLEVMECSLEELIEHWNKNNVNSTQRFTACQFIIGSLLHILKSLQLALKVSGVRYVFDQNFLRCKVFISHNLL